MPSFAIYLYGRDRGPLPANFETLADRLQAVDRLYFEMDGSFVWTGGESRNSWQLDGMVYDAAGKVQYLDLKGWCPFPNWHFLLETIASDHSHRADWIVVRMPEMSELSLGHFETIVWPETACR